MKRLYLPILILIAFATMYGCDELYREDMSDCYVGVSVAVVIDPSTPDVRAVEQNASTASIYVFDSHERLLEVRQTEPGKSETLYYPDAGPLIVVGWINDDENIFDLVMPYERYKGELNLIEPAAQAA